MKHKPRLPPHLAVPSESWVFGSIFSSIFAGTLQLAKRMLSGSNHIDLSSTLHDREGLGKSNEEPSLGAKYAKHQKVAREIALVLQ